MKIECEISRPHYHPGPDFDMKVTKKRDLSVPPHWVANERIERDGKSYAIVMPPRDKELYEERQQLHIHLPSHVVIKVKGKEMIAKVKVEPYLFKPTVHFDDVEAKVFNIESGMEAEL